MRLDIVSSLSPYCSIESTVNLHNDLALCLVQLWRKTFRTLFLPRYQSPACFAGPTSWPMSWCRSESIDFQGVKTSSRFAREKLPDFQAKSK